VIAAVTFSLRLSVRNDYLIRIRYRDQTERSYPWYPLICLLAGALSRRRGPVCCVCAVFRAPRADSLCESPGSVLPAISFGGMIFRRRDIDLG
jgi:hypothetical protein